MRLQATASMALVAAVSAYSHSTSSATAAAPAPAPRTGAAAPAAAPAKTGADPRVGLKPGKADAGQALEYAQLLANAPSGEGFNTTSSSDLAFTGKYAVQGNYLGFKIY